MLLKPAGKWSEFTKDSRDRRRVILSCAVLVFFGAPLCVTGAEKACIVEIPVYDFLGKKLSFAVTRVVPQDGAALNLLTVRPNAIKSEGDKLLVMDPSLLRRVVIATLTSAKREQITQRILLMQCPQRTSVRFGSSEAYGDLAFQTVHGRLLGCRFTGDWWVRAMPMFGSYSSSTGMEGPVNQDGSFALSGQVIGQRHILVVGKDEQPVKAVGVDVAAGKPNDAGSIDLSGVCPK